MTSYVERLRNLEQIERNIASALETAGTVVSELGKEKPVLRSVESHTTQFLKTVNSIENDLMKHINHLSQVVTTHPHTGSSYGAFKDCQMSTQRLEHVLSRLDDLGKLKGDQQASSYRQSELRRALSQSHQIVYPPPPQPHTGGTT